MSHIVKSILSALALLFLVAGCGIEGKWQLKEVHPPEAGNHFNLQEIEFLSDDTFVAKSIQDGSSVETRGRYELNDWTNKLMLRMGAKELEYDAQRWWLTELRLKRELENGRDFTAIFEPAEEKPEVGSTCPTCGQEVK